jgi:hypothetical protein
MDIKIKEQFIELWSRFFNKAELPIICYYTDGTGGAVRAAPPKKGHSCFVCELAKVRNGESVYYDAENIICGGGKRYLGFTDQMRPSFRYFLSCGIPGEMEGERYIKTPELVDEIQKGQKKLPVTGKNLVLKRWDKLEESDDPQVVIFFATPDVLSGLYTLTNFDRIRPDAIYTPFGAGCGSIIHYPYLEISSDKPRAVIGMFDISARPCVPANVLSFALPMKRFVTIMGNMEESFLITDSWKQVQKRIP